MSEFGCVLTGMLKGTRSHFEASRLAFDGPARTTGISMEIGAAGGFGLFVVLAGPLGA